MSRLYIRVLTSFYTHRKTVRLRLKIGDDAYWIVPRLWAYAAENQPDGNFSGYTSEEMAELLGCSKYATSIRQALLDSGWLDGDGAIHDWAQHNGYHEKFSERAKIAANARWASVKEKSPTPPKEKKEDIESGGKHTVSNACSIKNGVKHWKPTEEQIRICGLLRRRTTTRWSLKEIVAWKAITPVAEEDFLVLEKYYRAKLPLDRDYRRREVLTLLNNWNGEVDKARNFKAPSIL